MLCLVTFASAWATAQENAAPKEDEILVNMIVNYSFAYRQGTWVPVDVFVQNEKRDFTGWVEVRTYEYDQLESPIYRVPAECPKGSKKRFQLCCHLDRTSSVEVRLYDGRREVLDFPMRLDVRPIEDKDLLGLVLDEDGSGFGFLNEVVNTTPDGKPRPESDLRFYRGVVPTEGTPFLARHLQCYVPFDVIVLGNIDPNRIGERHRELLYDYVRGGGTVAVCLGEYTPKYRGTWVEDLIGASIGQVETVNEQALADAVFAEGERKGARNFRDCILAPLTPVAPETKRCGNAKVIATRRSLGSGFVYAIAIDSDSHALQECTGYRRLWEQIASRRRTATRLNTTAAAQFTANSLPRVSGITIFSRSSVIAYLLTYFLVGIVGNWLFFSWLKRREWAWVVLVLCSLGFTTYAVVFGTAGRVQSAELQQIETLSVPKGGGFAELNSCVGLLDARTRTHALTMARDYALARDVIDPGPDQYGRRGRPRVTTRRPFYLVQDDLPRVESFRVGASETRIMHVQADVAIPGGIDGRLEVRGKGVLAADLTNNTGFAFKDAFIFVDGQIFPIKGEGNLYTAEFPNYQRPRGGETQNYGIDNNTYTRGMSRRSNSRYSSSEPLEVYRNRALQKFRHDYPAHLFSKGAFTPYGDAIQFDPDMGPFFCAWIEGSGIGTVAEQEGPRQTINETLVVADIDIVRGSDQGCQWQDLVVFSDFLATAPSNWRPPRPGTVPEMAYSFRCGDKLPVYIGLTQDILSRGAQDLEIVVEGRSMHNHSVVFVPDAAPASWAREHRVERRQMSMNYRNVPVVTFSTADWRQYLRDYDHDALGEYWTTAVEIQQRMIAEEAARPSGSRLGRALSALSQPLQRPGKVLVGHLQIAEDEGVCPVPAEWANNFMVTARACVNPEQKTSKGDEHLWQ